MRHERAPRGRFPVARFVVALLAMSLISSACSTTTSAPTPSADSEPPPPTAAPAAILCPILWEWTKAIGAAFNDASQAMPGLAEPDRRRDRWEEALGEMETRNTRLLADVAPLAEDAVLGPLVEDITAGVAASLAEIDDIRGLFAASPEVDEERHQVRTSQIVVRVEKVIDVVKPELADHDTDGSLIAAFRAVPSCQHAVKDANDGVPRAND